MANIELQYKNQARNMSAMMENNLNDFFENGVMGKMGQIEKVYKKLEYKLKNLKKAVIMAKDREEDKVSSRLIE